MPEIASRNAPSHPIERIPDDLTRGVPPRAEPERRGLRRAQFDEDYRAALNEAGRALELAGVLDTVEHWRTRAWITRDPAEQRRVVRRAAELITGQQPPADESVAVTEARL